MGISKVAFPRRLQLPNRDSTGAKLSNAIKCRCRVIDNASIHTSEAFEDRLPSWKKQGLIIKYLPPYSPELNLIEILWRRIKYTWLPFSAYACLNALSEALETILSHVGSEYQITFA